MKYVMALLALAACLLVVGCSSSESNVGMAIETPTVAPTPREDSGWLSGEPRDLRSDWYGGQVGYRFDR